MNEPGCGREFICAPPTTRLTRLQLDYLQRESGYQAKYWSSMQISVLSVQQLCVAAQRLAELDPGWFAETPVYPPPS